MRKLQLSTLLMVFVSMLFAVSCNETPIDDTPKTSAIELAQTSINVAADGSVCAVDYTIVNGIAGIDIVAKSSAEWISDIATADGKLSFKVMANTSSEERSADIAIKYPSIDDTILKVTQAGIDGVTFQIELTDKTTTTCKSKIVPSDPEAPYIVMVADVNYFYQAGITNVEELFQDDYNYFMNLAKQYEVELLEEFLLMNEFAFKGEKNITWTQMTPDTEYVMYAYAIEINDANNDYTLASPVSHIMFTLSSTDLAEVKFDISVDVKGPEVTYHIAPIDWDGMYYLDIYEQGDWMYRPEGTVLDEEYARVVSNTWMSMMSMYMQQGYGAEQLMQIMCLQGEDSYSEVRKASTNYAMVIYAIDMVDDLPQVVSMPQLFNFSTEEVKPSDMQLNIEVANNYVRVADISVTPTVDDEPYTVAIVSTDEIPEGDDNVIIKWMTDNFYLSTFKGSIFSHVNTLKPESGYTVLAFGYYGDTVTTPLFRKDFTTEAEGECLNSIINITWDAPYSLAELEARFPDKYYNYGMFENLGWYAMWSEIETAEPTQDMFYSIYRADRFAVEGEEAIFTDLVEYVSTKTQLLTAENDVLYVMCAVIMDYKGNYSPMWVSEPFRYTYNAETKKPLEELLAKLGLEEEPTAQSLSLVAKRK